MFHSMLTPMGSDGRHIGEELVLYWYDPDEDLWVWHSYCPVDSRYDGDFISQKIGIPIKINGGETLYPNYDITGFVYYKDGDKYLWADYDYYYGNKWYYSNGVGSGTEEHVYNLSDIPVTYTEFDYTNCIFTGDEFWETPWGGYYGLLSLPTLKPRGSALQNNLPDKVITPEIIKGWKAVGYTYWLKTGIYAPFTGTTANDIPQRNRYVGWIKYDEVSWVQQQNTYNGVAVFKHTDGRYLWRRNRPNGGYEWIISDTLGIKDPLIGYWVNQGYPSGNYYQGTYVRVFEQPTPIPSPLRTPPSPSLYPVGVEQFEDTGSVCNGEIVLFSTRGNYLWKSNILNKWVISSQTGVTDKYIGYWTSNSILTSFSIVFESVNGSVQPAPDNYLLGQVTWGNIKMISCEGVPPIFPVSAVALFS